MIDIFVGATSALVTALLTLAAVLRFYLPRHDRRVQNPWGEQVLQEMRQMHQENLQHHAREETWWAETQRTLGRMEGKLP